MNLGFAGGDLNPAKVVPFFRPPEREQTVAEQQAIVMARLGGLRGK